MSNRLLFPRSLRHRSQGVALVITVAMLVLVTFVIVAFFTKATNNRAVENSSVGGVRAEVLARSSVQAIIGELRKEMLANSDPVYTAKDSYGNYRLRPNTPQDAVPQLVLSQAIMGSGNAKFNNLIKQSVHTSFFYSGSGATIEAAPVSTTAPSLDGRVVSLNRWNSPLLIGDSTGVSGFDSKEQLPEWVMVTRSGINSSVTISDAANPLSPNFVVGRFAFNIYNEGGLLDINIAGYPNAVATSGSDLKVIKGTLAGADLTQIPGVPDQNAVNDLVAWRNGAGISNYSNLPPSSLAGYTKLVTQYSGTMGFLERWMAPSLASSDQRFIGRQDLIHYIRDSGQSGITTTALPYLSTYSRTLNQPSYWPAPNRPTIGSGPGSINTTGALIYSGGNSAYQQDNLYNPALKTVSVSTAFTRNDGSQAVVGEPLVKKRFALNRLCWITYKGPSANLSTSDPVYQSYLANGISAELISQGTPANIQKYFGLTWTDGNNNSSGTMVGGYWVYNHGIAGSGGGITVGRLCDVAALSGASAREADFFELLQAATNVGSLAKAWAGTGGGGNYSGNSGTQPFNEPVIVDSRLVYHVLQLGSNIIDEANPTQYPTHIEFQNTSGSIYSIYGATDLPYFSSLNNIAFIARPSNPVSTDGSRVTPAVTLVDSGLGVFMAVPSIWNPYDPNGPAAVTGPQQLRIVLGNPAPATSFNSNPVSTTWMATTYPWHFAPNDSGTAGATVTYAQWSSEASTALDFSNARSLYREPTYLLQYGLPAGSNLAPESGNVIAQSGGVNGGGIKGIYDNNATSGAGQPLVGFMVGTFPVRWNSGGASGTTYTVAYVTPLNPGEGICLRLEYLSGATWIPYKEYFTMGENLSVVFPLIENGSASAPYVLTPANNCLWTGNSAGKVPTLAHSTAADVCSAWDPRSTRFGWWKDLPQPQFLETTAPPAQDTAQTLRQGTAIGATSTHNSNTDMTGNSVAWGFISGALSTLGTFPQNVISGGYSYYKDADGIVRRGMAGYVSNPLPSVTTGLPLTTGNYASRPLMLHRPFHSVAELGYVFSDTPWKNIDFFTPESGFSGLLDVFCINDDNRSDALLAGRVDLNGKQAPVFSAILSQAFRDEEGATATLSSEEASSIAQALTTRTSSTQQGKGPLTNIGDLVGRYTSGFSNANGQPYDGFSADLSYMGGTTSINNLGQRFRETAMRALADNGQAGTWNLLIDIVAQAGRYPTSAKGLANFEVEGEHRYWVHVAIDRQTGEVIDKQVEQVNE